MLTAAVVALIAPIPQDNDQAAIVAIITWFGEVAKNPQQAGPSAAGV